MGNVEEEAEDDENEGRPLVVGDRDALPGMVRSNVFRLMSLVAPLYRPVVGGEKE